MDYRTHTWYVFPYKTRQPLYTKQQHNIKLFIEYKRKPVCTNILTKDEHMKYKKWHHANVVAFQAMFKYSLTQYMSVKTDNYVRIQYSYVTT